MRPNLTFAAAVEELSLNVSLSFMSEPSLSHELLLTNVEAQSSRQIYVYRPKNLAISYGLGISLTFCAFLYGIYTYVQNGRISYDNLFSSIAGSSQHPAMAKIAAERPLDLDLMDKKLYNTRWRMGEYSVPVRDANRAQLTSNNRFGFVPMDT